MFNYSDLRHNFIFCSGVFTCNKTNQLEIRIINLIILIIHFILGGQVDIKLSLLMTKGQLEVEVICARGIKGEPPGIF